MIATRLRRHVLVAAVVWIAAATAAVAQQNPLSRAKELYANASYDEALAALGKLPGKIEAVESTEQAAYQVFCLLALGRAEDAKIAVEAIVRTDFLYHPSEGMASPKVRAFFEEARRPLLTDLARAGYVSAKGHFERKEMAEAVVDFDRLITLLNEMEESGQGLGDLRTLSIGFRDLAKAAVAPPPPPKPVDPPPAPVEAPKAAAPSAPAPIPIYGIDDATVVKPVPIARPIPDWKPTNPIDAMREYRGAIEIIIDEKGSVMSAVMTTSIHPIYDPMLLKSARGWKFKPATKDGAPVRFRSRLDIHLSATREPGRKD
ncbi:MAG TPA: hypothetical protein VFV98_08390 [Vicinamibacterales bacterium]|nr:hypothetical protein [Vicinamibacterales bacterium]